MRIFLSAISITLIKRPKANDMLLSRMPALCTGPNEDGRTPPTILSSTPAV